MAVRIGVIADPFDELDPFVARKLAVTILRRLFRLMAHIFGPSLALHTDQRAQGLLGPNGVFGSMWRLALRAVAAG